MDFKTMTKAEASHFATSKAREIACEAGIGFEAAYRNLLDAYPGLKEAVAGTGKALSPSDRLVRKYVRAGETEEEARRLAALDPGAARRHIDQTAAAKLRQARREHRPMMYAEAMKSVIKDNPPIALRAGLLMPRGTSEGTQHMLSFYQGRRVPDEVQRRYHRRYAAGAGVASTWFQEMRGMSQDMVIDWVVDSCKRHNLAQPGQVERNFVDEWFGVTSPPPVPVAGGNDNTLQSYNSLRQMTIDAILVAARAILRDSRERAQIAPTLLGA